MNPQPRSLSAEFIPALMWICNATGRNVHIRYILIIRQNIELKRISCETVTINASIKKCLASYIPFPVDSILEAMLTVSPNKQYLGMAVPTTPAAHPPVCRPIRSCSLDPGRWRILKLVTPFNKSSAMLAISPECFFPFRRGRPLTHM